ncbi:LTXXQ motif family protein [Methylobacterium sp. C25]|uniref:Spy/CpxP family protein refolding chaperone n=1 Tax=Methylobacterium sp. C25 TaxID=2721622 RepID=UPI001F4825FE|nr:Spy/CpxP family protein refolding chaperone [Methylobacterium sp. C25]MCE4222655.1 LTXXQ motif family protein [Methylobacterium sp. C25]
MSKRVIVAVMLAGLAGAGAIASASAEGRHGWDGPGHRHGRWSALTPEDRAAFADARIAALHTGMKLNADQEKLWPPVEAAMRDMFKQRQARMQAWRERGEKSQDAPTRLRAMADAATARGEALRKLADATGPLYATLDEGQKRRAAILAHPLRGRGGDEGGHGGWRHRGGEGDGPGDKHND